MRKVKILEAIPDKIEKSGEFYTGFKIFPDSKEFFDLVQLFKYLFKKKIKLLWCDNLNVVGQIIKERYFRYFDNLKLDYFDRFDNKEKYSINFLVNQKSQYYKIIFNFRGSNFKTYLFGFNNLIKYYNYANFNGIISALKELDSFLKPFKISLLSSPESIPLTIGEISKRLLLDFMYHKKNYYANLYSYQMSHRYDYNDRNGLYHGGLNFFNEKYKNKIISDVYVYDINSFYPSIMLQAGDLYGKPEEYKELTDELIKKIKETGSVAIYIFNKLIMKVKKNSVPVFNYMDNFWPDFYFNYKPNSWKSLAMFDFEFENLKKFYDIKSFNIFFIKVFKRKPYAYDDFINYFYDVKKNNPSKLIKEFSKLILNTSYGKIGQNPQTSAVEFDKDNIQPDQTIKLKKIKTVYRFKSKMSTVNAAYITALGRCTLCKKILEICGPNLARNFIYSDCDSIHTFKKYLNLSDEIGGIKLVEFATRARYLDFKKYLLINDLKKSFSAIISGFSPTNDDFINYNKTLTQLINNFKPGTELINWVGVKVANGVEMKKIKKEL